RQAGRAAHRHRRHPRHGRELGLGRDPGRHPPADRALSRRAMSLLQVRGVAKRFGATVALDGVDLALEAGEVRALIGENGAGKSTLMNILAGGVRADRGEMEIDGQLYAPASPIEARRGRRAGSSARMWIARSR